MIFMSKDINDMTLQELLDLEKKIQKAKKKLGTTYKSELVSTKRLLYVFAPKLSGDIDEDERTKVAFQLEGCIRTICDYAIGNYKVVTRNGKKGIARNSAVVTMAPEDVERYKNMSNSIIDIMVEAMELTRREEER